MLAVTDTGIGMDDGNARRTSSSRSSPPRKPAKAPASAWRRCTASSSRAADSSRVEAELGVGSTFEVYFPRVNDPIDSNSAGPNIPACKTSQRTVLLVEDEPGVRDVACEFLTAAGYRVLAAEDGERAMQFAARETTIDILITDIVMPRMRGPELARELRRWKPDVKIVYMSGYLEAGDAEADLLKDAYFVNKPFSREVLLNQVAEALCQSPSVKVTVQPAAS